MTRKHFRLTACLLAIMLILTSCGGTSPNKDNSSANQSTSAASSNVSASGGGKLTDVGVPRKETLIVDMLNGRATNISQLNPYLPGVVYQGNGFRQFVWEPLWEVDSVNGKQFPLLASTMAEPVNSSMTKFRFKLREGVKWSDGVDLTSEDVVFTSDMLLNIKELAYSGAYSNMVKKMTAVDKYTVEVETLKPEAKLEQFLGVTVTDTNFKILPKHIWEKNDPKTFQNSQSIASGPYTLKNIDPQGNWFLFEKRADWKNSATGLVAGEPTPKYILFRTYGPEEKRVMATIQNDMDILTDISPESWDILRQKNTNTMAWYKDFPYADMDDPAVRGVQFNCSKPPFDNEKVRWALTLAIDLKNVSMSAYGGMLRVSPIALPPTKTLTSVYHKPMLDWLRSFQLGDGYKPFDESYAKSVAQMLKQQGIQGLPTGDQEISDIFGTGWWKYDPVEAEKLLKESGFTKKNDKWMLPDGKPWQISLVTPSGFEVLATRLGFAVVDSWKKFGIDVTAQQVDTTTYNTVGSNGQFECGIYWPIMSVVADATSYLLPWHKKFIVPNGQAAPGGAVSGANSRWRNDRVSEIIDRLGGIPSNDSRIIPEVTGVMQEFVKGMPFIPMVGTSKFVPVNTYYWSGFQSSSNYFEGPWWWWSNFRMSLSHYKPTGKD